MMEKKSGSSRYPLCFTDQRPWCSLSEGGMSLGLRNFYRLIYPYLLLEYCYSLNCYCLVCFPETIINAIGSSSMNDFDYYFWAKEDPNRWNNSQCRCLQLPAYGILHRCLLYWYCFLKGFCPWHCPWCTQGLCTWYYRGSRRPLCQRIRRLENVPELLGLSLHFQFGDLQDTVSTQISTLQMNKIGGKE